MVSVPGVRSSPGFHPSKNTQENHNFLPLLTIQFPSFPSFVTDPVCWQQSHCTAPLTAKCVTALSKCTVLQAHIWTSKPPCPQYYLFYMTWVQTYLLSTAGTARPLRNQEFSPYCFYWRNQSLFLPRSLSLWSPKVPATEVVVFNFLGPGRL